MSITIRGGSTVGLRGDGSRPIALMATSLISLSPTHREYWLDSHEAVPARRLEGCTTRRWRSGAEKCILIYISKNRASIPRKVTDDDKFRPNHFSDQAGS